MAEWPLVAIEELVENILDRRGVTPIKLGSDFTTTGHRVISAKLVKGGAIDLAADEPRYVDERTYARWMRSPLRADDVIVTSEAPLGEVAYLGSDVDWVLGQRLFALRTDKRRLHGRYLYYALQTDPSRSDLQTRATGTTAQGVRQTELRRVRIPLPPLAEQRRIAGILGALDDKTELNRLMAETLEGLARAAYAELQANRREDWPAGSIADVALNPRDQVDPRQVDPATRYIGLEHVPRGRMVVGEWGQAAAAESGKMAFQQNDILFGKLRPYFRKVGVVSTSGICSTEIIVIRPRRAEDLGYVLAVTTDPVFIDASNATSTGTRMPRTSWSDLVRYSLPIPPAPARAAFTKRVWPLIERAQAAMSETRMLKQIRDRLLPGLVSGDIEVAA